MMGKEETRAGQWWGRGWSEHSAMTYTSMAHGTEINHNRNLKSLKIDNDKSL
jgi:hypothetical protein